MHKKHTFHRDPRLARNWEYDRLLEKAAAKKPAARKLSLAEGKKIADKLIDTWHKEK